MGDKTKGLRINLLASMPDQNDAPSAGTVAVTFDASSNTVTLGTSKNVSVDKDKMRVLFDLTANNLPSGASASIAGIEFTKPDEPSGTYAPSNVFDDPSSFTDQSGASHTVYGEWKSGKSRLKLVDHDRLGTTGTEQDYGYRVWVKLTSGTSTNYYSSPDPEIRNKPTTS